MYEIFGIFNLSQAGVIIVLRPDLIDYEINQQFDLVIVAHDLVLPENQRRQVYKLSGLTVLELS